MEVFGMVAIGIVILVGVVAFLYLAAFAKHMSQ